MIFHFSRDIDLKLRLIVYPQQVNHHREPGTPHLEYGFWQKNVELLLLPIVIAWQDYVKGVSMWGQCFLLWRLVLELEMLPHVQEKKQMASPKSYERNPLLTC